MIETPCVIFAGGKSSRMGEDKSLLPFGGYTSLAQYQYQRLSKIFSSVYIVTKSSSKFSFEANFIEDLPGYDTYAPTIAFLSIYQRLSSESFLAISVDAPFIDTAIIEQLIEEDREEYDATIASTPSGMQPLCGVYHRSLEHSFQEMLHSNEHKLGKLLKDSQTHFVAFPESTKFLNLNHKEEYLKAVEIFNN